MRRRTCGQEPATEGGKHDRCNGVWRPYFRPTRIDCCANHFGPGFSVASAAGEALAGTSPPGKLANTLAIVCSGPGVDTVGSSISTGRCGVSGADCSAVRKAVPKQNCCASADRWAT